jgi:hypothetical protein
VWDRADTVVWPDVARSRAMRRVVARTIRRAITREKLWNGNVEPLRNFFDPRPTHNIIMWTWTRHGPTRDKLERMTVDPRWAHFEVVRLGDGDEEAFLESLGVEGAR